MKIKSLFAVAIATFAASFASADQGDILVTFSTPGIDKYADGSPVADGEWYALCWAKDGQFDGLKTDGSPVAANEELILAAPLAKDGKCPFTAFEFARATKYNAGKFSIFLLDTRDAAGNPAKTRDQVFVKSAVVAQTAAKGGADAVTATAAVAAGGSVAWVQPELQADLQKEVTAVEIKSFEIVDANVKLTIANVPGVTYVVRTGETVKEMNTYTVAAPSTAEGTSTFIVSKAKGKFFSVGTLAK